MRESWPKSAPWQPGTLSVFSASLLSKCSIFSMPSLSPCHVPTPAAALSSLSSFNSLHRVSPGSHLTARHLSPSVPGDAGERSGLTLTQFDGKNLISSGTKLEEELKVVEQRAPRMGSSGPALNSSQCLLAVRFQIKPLMSSCLGFLL